MVLNYGCYNTEGKNIPYNRLSVFFKEATDLYLDTVLSEACSCNTHGDVSGTGSNGEVIMKGIRNLVGLTGLKVMKGSGVGQAATDEDSLDHD